MSKNLENSQFFQYLGHAEKTFDHKIGNLLEKNASHLISSSGVFRSFCFTEIFLSQIKTHQKCQKFTKILTFSTLCGKFEPFRNRSLQIFLQKPTEM